MLKKKKNQYVSAWRESAAAVQKAFESSNKIMNNEKLWTIKLI